MFYACISLQNMQKCISNTLLLPFYWRKMPVFGTSLKISPRDCCIVVATCILACLNIIPAEKVFLKTFPNVSRLWWSCRPILIQKSPSIPKRVKDQNTCMIKHRPKHQKLSILFFLQLSTKPISAIFSYFTTTNSMHGKFSVNHWAIYQLTLRRRCCAIIVFASMRNNNMYLESGYISDLWKQKLVSDICIIQVFSLFSAFSVFDSGDSFMWDIFTTTLLVSGVAKITSKPSRVFVSRHRPSASCLIP
jgi:hypothetical protein